MKISIITVCFNSEETIRDTIESVLAQTYPDIEYIIVDGESNDNTLSIIQEYQSQISKVVSEPDKGIYDAMNKGISLATGEVVGVLNSDDFFPHNEVISEVAEVYKTNPKTDMVLAGVEFVRSGDLNKVVRRYRSTGFKPWKLRFGIMPPHPSAYIRKKVYANVGQYKLDYKIGADFDFFVRALLATKHKYVTDSRCWVRMRVGGVSTSGFSSFKTITQEIVKSFRENKIYTNSVFVSSRFFSKLLQLK
ncbi:MAG: glycosyltransferase family 2 protein [Desulfuromonas sp.]